MKAFDHELHAILSLYVGGDLSLDDFKRWLAQSIWGLLDSTSALDRMVVGEIQMALDAHGDKEIDEGTVRQQAEAMLFILDAVQAQMEKTGAIAA